jgi:peroxiredoxin
MANGSAFLVDGMRLRMKKNWKPLGLVFLVVSLAVFLYLDSRSGNPTQPQVSDLKVGISIGNLAPDFSAINLEGDSLQLSDFRGQTVLINAFASWCGPCRLEAPHLAQVYAEFGGDDVIFLGLNMGEPPGDVAAFRDEFGLEFPLIMDGNGRLAGIYKPIGLPTTWVIGPDGVIRYIHAGPVTAEMLVEAIQGAKDANQTVPSEPSTN